MNLLIHGQGQILVGMKFKTKTGKENSKVFLNAYRLRGPRPDIDSNSNNKDDDNNNTILQTYIARNEITKSTFASN